MSKFKEGQRVKIREDLVTDKSYGSDSFVDKMEPYLGSYATIEMETGKGYKLDIDEGKWVWTDEMLQSVEEHFWEDNYPEAKEFSNCLKGVENFSSGFEWSEETSEKITKEEIFDSLVDILLTEHEDEQEIMLKDLIKEIKKDINN